MFKLDAQKCLIFFFFNKEIYFIEIRVFLNISTMKYDGLVLIF